MNLFHHSSAWVAKHKKHHHAILATLALVVAGAGVYTYRHEFAQAATYTFTQSSWGGGITANTATHSSNQSGWTQYTATSSTSVLAGAGGVSLSATSRTFTDDGFASSTWATVGSGPRGLAFDASGNLYVANNTTGSISKVTSAGVVSTFATGVTAPIGITFDTAGNLYAVAGTNAIYKITPAGVVSTFASGTGTAATALVFDSAGNLYTAGSANTNLNKITPAGALSTLATIQLANSIVLDASGNIYLGGYSSNVIQKVTPSGTVSTFASLSGGINTRVSLVFDSAGNLYAASSAAGTVFKITSSGTVTTHGTVGSTPIAIAMDALGNIYTANSGASTISKITPAGVVTTSFATTGSIASASMAVDSLGNLFVSNSGGSSVGRFATIGGFESGTNSSTAVSGSGGGASVGLYRGTPNAWTAMTSAPGSIFYGAALVHPGSGDYIYASRGNTNTFYRYSITGNSWSTMANIPGALTVGAELVYPGSGDYIYGFQGGTTAFYRYSISGDSWTTMTAAPAVVSYGGALVYPGSGDYIYAYQGNNTTAFWRYSISGNSWTAMTSAPGAIFYGAALVYPGSGDYIYGYQGSTTNFYRYSISGNSWTTMAVTPAAISVGGDLVYPGSGDYIYGFQGSSATSFYRYSISGNSWSSMTGLPTAVSYGGDLVYPGSGDYIYGVAGNNTTAFYRYTIAAPYSTPGTFTSTVLNMGAAAAFTTLSYAATLNGQTLTVDARAGNTATPDGTWTAWQTGIASGGSIAGLAGNQYFQYRVNLSTSNTSVTPTLDSLTINYSQYATSGNLTSSVYDTESAANLMSNILWSASGTGANETVKLQVRSSSDGATWSNWCGPSIACTGSDYFTVNTGVVGGLPAGHPLNTGGNDRYMQYKVFLTSLGSATPALTSVTLQYVVNAPPVISNITASQNSNGTVTVGYDISDTDNGIGNIADITLQYCTTNCTTGQEVWVDAITVSGNVGTGVALGAGRSIVWTPSTDYASQYKVNTQKVRIKANDRDAANNLGYGTSGTFSLDTTSPVVVATLNSSGAQDVVTITATDGSSPEYRLCNTADFAACATWSSITSGVATPVNWMVTGAPNTETVYLQVRDAYSNTTSQTIVAPAAPGNFDYKDISNTANNDYWEFISWSVSANVSGATFGSYKVYHSNDGGSTYNLLATITDANTNFYRHVITTATSSLQYYKVATVDTDGDVSNYTSVLSDIPNGQGGADSTAPTISAIAVPSGNLKNTSAQITFTTDELATAQVLYGTTLAASCNFGTSQTSSSYVTAQSVYLSNLAPSTTYYFCVKATDVTGNVSAGVDGGTFTTVGGPVISTVTVSNITDVSASIVWNTSTSSDSYIYYSTNSTLASPSTIGSATMVTESPIAGVFPHQVNLSGLTAGTRYYYYVKSTDALGNITTDTNSGAYYSFVTTLDTTPPVISSIATPVISSNAAVVVWQTDELATSQVLYGGTTGDRSKFMAADTTRSIYHVVTLSSATTNSGALGGTNQLTPSTTYYYVVKSVDAAGNTATSDEQTVTTSSEGSVTINTIVAVSVSNTPTGTEADTTAPTISNVAVTDITPFGATVSFTTSEDTDGFVKYGKDSSYGDIAGDDAWTTSHIIKLKGLSIGTDYFAKIIVHDKAGNTGISGEQAFKTLFLSEESKDMTKIENIEQFQKEIENTIESILPSLVPPFVSKPQVTDIAEDSAVVTFKTNIKAFPVVVYADDASYGEKKENPYSGEVSDTINKATDHSITITGLKGNTKYHLQARAFSLPKVIGKSADITFTTKAAKIHGAIAERKKDSFTVVWTTEEPTTSIIEYKNVKTGITERKIDGSMKVSHSLKIENLPSGTLYEVNISGVNEKGNVLEGGEPLSVTTSRDVTAPVLSGFKVDNALVPGRTDRIQTIVSWTTDEPSNSVVYYEEGAGAAGETRELANKKEVLDSYTTGHSVILPNLKPGTIYRLKVASTDDSGNTGTFGPRTVITPRQTESITDIIFKNFEESFRFLQKI